MWKCKECGGTEFEGEFHQKIRVDIDEEGNIIPSEKLEAEILECTYCGLDGDFIEEIADWIEEEENE